MIYALLALSITLAALLGRVASRPRQRLRAWCGLAIVVLAASALLLSDSINFAPPHRFALVATTIMVVATATLPTFGAAWVASGPAWIRQGWVWVSALVGLGSFLAFPIIATYASCYVFHDC